VRPSDLARFWGIHTKTLHGWIKQGRLVALRSPGNHVRLRAADVRAFCEREGRTIPPFVEPPSRRAVVAGASEAAARAVSRALKGTAVSLEVCENPYEGVIAAASGSTDLLALGVSFPKFDGAAAIRALKRSAAGARTVVVAFGVPTRAGAELLESAGAARALGRANERDVASVVRELLAIGPQ
jgi:excisionase family DNA binding protein